jgi:EAL domain-containing protein (putative c-di-GMP-specific phosphodiesterase class I)
VSASIGITHYPQRRRRRRGLFKHADQALYAAKDAGRNRVHRFTPALQDRAQLRAPGQRPAPRAGRAAVAAGLPAHHRPAQRARCTRPRRCCAGSTRTHGLVSPAEFIPIAESTGLIVDIGDWVFRTAAAQALAWRRQLHPRFQISVNKSPVQFHNDPAQRWAGPHQLAALGLPGDCVAVEITEGLLLDTSLRGRPAAGAARRRHARCRWTTSAPASVLAYLQRFDIDYLKIDQLRAHLVPVAPRAVQGHHRDGARAGPEGHRRRRGDRDPSCDWLQAAGCDALAQGYLFAPGPCRLPPSRNTDAPRSATPASVNPSACRCCSTPPRSPARAAACMADGRPAVPARGQPPRFADRSARSAAPVRAAVRSDRRVNALTRAALSAYADHRAAYGHIP